MGTRIKKDDQVVVIAGKDKGTKGRVMRVLREFDRVLVEGVNKVKRHTKPTPKNPQGGIVEREQPIHLSNVMPLDGEKPTRVKMGKDKDGKKVRQAVRSGATLD
jgi:large subunit ribosomal protein L24